MPKPGGSLSAIVVSGGKQYRVRPGDQILVDRMEGEPGSALKLDRVLLFSHGDEIKVGAPGVEGVDVDVKILGHRRGPRLESLRYKSKKRVRVHHGGRADLTALQIIAIGGLKGAEAEGEEAERAEAAEKKPKSKAGARPAKAKAKAEKVQAAAPEAAESEREAPAKPVRRARKAKETK